jgi:hypothetical protein
VKLAQFYDLCRREWESTARGGRGVVVSVRLTGPSLAELTADVLAGWPGTAVCALGAPDSEVADVRGARISQIQNPLTRSIVKISARDGKRETARVHTLGGTFRQTWWPTGA